MLDPKTIKAMVAAGCSPEVLAAAVISEQEADLEKRLAQRAEWRERQRRSRANRKDQQNQHSCHGDIERHSVTMGDTPSPLSPPSPSDKEKVSTPLKEINSLSPLYPPSPDLTGLRKTSLRDLEFEQVWKIYPNKKSKKESERAFQKARKKVSLETITDALYAYIKNTDPSFLAHLATWLNQERWNDEYATTSPLFPAKPLTNFQQREQTRAATLAALTNGTIQLDTLFGGGNAPANGGDVCGRAQRALPPLQPDDGVSGGDNSNVHDLFRKGTQGSL